MIKSKFKRVTSLFLATLMCVTTFAGIGSTTAYAASGEKADVYMVDFPRDGDANYDGVWGHSNLTLKNGWHTGRSNFTNLKAIGSYSGNVAYCIEPGISLKVGQTMNKYDENYFNNLAANGVISGDEIRLFVGRILQYGYRGTISTSWRSQNEAAANSIAQAYATQLLIWETVIGERDTNFNHVAASGCSNVKDVINAKHPLRNKIFSYYNSMVQSVQNHATIPSFCNKSSGLAKTIELEWNGSKYTTTLTDSNNVLSKYNFKASISGVSFSVNGNKLTVSMDTAPSKEFTITATKKNAVRRGVVVWSEGKHGQNSSVQDVVSYAQEVSDSINGYVKMKVSYGSCQIVKTSEDGKVDGINFTITGNGINQTVTTANGGKFQIDNLMPGIYTVTEQAYDKYEPQETHRVTVVAGQVAKVNFNNKLKRGDLQVVKSSEDNLVEGVKFHLFGTSLSGDAVDQYAVTDKNGVATFKDVLISGSEPYTLEEVDTAIRYVVPKNQTAPVKWKEVTTRNFNNILKKFTVTVTKSDAEKGEAQGNAKLSGAVYGIYKGETLVDKYVTDENGQFTTKEYVCDTDWTIREITPSEGYLLDKTIHEVGADPKLYEVNVSGSEDSDVIYQPVYEVAGLEGAVYEVRAAEDISTPDGTLRYSKGEVVDTITTSSDGFVKSKELYLGKYEVEEITAPDGMVISGETHTVELTYAGQNISVTETSTSFYNERQKVQVSLAKAIEKDKTFGIGDNGEIKNISFGLYAAEDIVSASGTVIPADGLIEIVSVNENGTGVMKSDLPFGKYYVKEIATDEHYILSDTKYPVVFEYAGQDTATVEIKVNDGKEIKNELIYGSVSGKKIDENGEALEGAVIGIFKAEETEFTKDTALMTTTSAKDGSFSFAKVPYGKWIVREIEQPKGFVLDEKAYEVNISKAEQVVEIEIVNEYVHGNIRLTKVDAEYPDNKLTGATFEVYKDTNENGKIDDGDELIGNLEETETGIYEMKELLYGKYIVRETKAPEGFLLDKGEYSVFIEKDETTYSVENKAGVGFINEAMRGTLKIVKTSSDGKVKGFAFRVTGANGYDMTFETDKNGEIVIEGLRIGEYTVSEVANNASAAYITPADQNVTIKLDETAVVKMHNELRDTPKTGDDTNMKLWYVLAGLSAVGIAVTSVVAHKKKKKEGNE